MNEIPRNIQEILNQSINKLDRPLNEVISELKKERDKEYSDFEYWFGLETSNPERYNEIDEIANQTGHSLQIQMREHIESALYVEDELLALLEMKIIYAFKHLEINIKKLIFHFFNELPNPKPKWHEMIDFLKKKNISVKELNGYTEANQLRLVNNSLKHSHQSVDKSLIEIEEFKNGSIQNFESLESFYERVVDSPSQFFCDLIEKVEKEVNDFNELKIKKIAEKATNRMNKETAEKLINEIKQKYK
ncbi:MAG: hypothetical protein H2058_11775 [Muricauda sp.]|nr:hypothetical protein [Allomuricauda sp.]MBA4745924.1 hypothetical protein [Allomuricauda sp.]